MDDSAATNSDPPQPSPPQQTQTKLSSTRRRRHSIATSVVVPTKLSLSAAAAATTTKPLQSFNTFPHHQNGTVSRPPPLDYDEILSLKCSPPQTYTSLKDILPVSAAVSSPTTASAAAVSSGYEISIRNRLVKQAAWAYLQPMSSSPGSSGPHILHRLWLSFLSFFKRHVVPGFTYLLHQASLVLPWASRGGGTAGLQLLISLLLLVEEDLYQVGFRWLGHVAVDCGAGQWRGTWDRRPLLAIAVGCAIECRHIWGWMLCA